MTTNRLEQHEEEEEVSLAYLNRDNNHYYFTWDRANHRRMIRTLGQFCFDDDLNFETGDACRMAKQIADMMKSTATDT